MYHLVRIVLLPIIIGLAAWWLVPQLAAIITIPLSSLVATLMVLALVLLAMALRFYQPALISQLLPVVLLALAGMMNWPGSARPDAPGYLLSNWALLLLPTLGLLLQPLLRRRLAQLLMLSALGVSLYLLLTSSLNWPVRTWLPAYWWSPLPYLQADPLALVITALSMLLLLIRHFVSPSWLLQAAAINLLLMFVLRYQLHADGMACYLVLVLMLLLLLLGILLDTHSLTYLDALTGIPNRRALMLKLATRSKQYSLAMLDVDHFKKFNDSHGHEVGDQVLKMVAKIISRVGAGGAAFRYGGEEFAILFNRMSAEQCVPYLEALRQDIEEYKMVLRQQGRPKKIKQGKKARGGGRRTEKLQVTISMGVADQRAGNSADQVMECADKALYQAKKAGRNRVKVF